MSREKSSRDDGNAQRNTYCCSCTLNTNKKTSRWRKRDTHCGEGMGQQQSEVGGGGNQGPGGGGGVGGETGYSKSFVATSLLLQAYKTRLLSRQKYAREFSFVATKVFSR